MEVEIYDEISSDEEIKAKIDFLNAQINERLNTFDALKNLNRKSAWVFKSISSMLGGVIAILLGLKLGPDFESIAVNIAIVLGSAITMISAWEIFWNPKLLWVKYTVTTNELRSLRSDLNYLLTKDITRINSREIDAIYERYCIILKETNEAWQKYRSEDRKK